MIRYFEESKDEKINNLSAIFFLKSSIVDIFAWPTELGLQERSGHLGESKFLQMTKVVSADPGRVGQFLNKPNLRKTDISSFLYNNLSILSIILLGYLMIKLSNLIFLKLSKQNNLSFVKTLKLTILRLLNLNQNASSTFVLLFLSLNIFLFFTLTVLKGTINTESVVVDQTKLIDSTDKIMNNDKILVTYYNEKSLLSDAPSNSFLKKLYDKKAKENKIFIFQKNLNVNDFKKFIDHGLATYLTISDYTSLLHFLSYISVYSTPDLISFLKSTNYYEKLSAFTMRRNLDKNKKKLIHKNIAIAFENGFLSYFNNKIKSISFSRLERYTKVFKTKEEFINEFTSTSSLNFENYKQTFFTFFVILAVTLTIFVFDKYNNKLKILYFHLKRVFHAICKLLTKCTFKIRITNLKFFKTRVEI